MPSHGMTTVMAEKARKRKSTRNGRTSPRKQLDLPPFLRRIKDIRRSKRIVFERAQVLTHLGFFFFYASVTSIGASSWLFLSLLVFTVHSPAEQAED